MSKRIWIGLILILSGLAAGCGGGGPVAVQVDMSEFSFAPETISAPAGAEIHLTLNNTGALDHNFLLMNAGKEVSGSWSETNAVDAFFTQIQTPGGESITVTFTAPSQPGAYQFLCSVPAHLEQGMTGTFTVTQP